MAKYLAHEDTYISVFEAIQAAAWANQVTIQPIWIDAEKLEGPNNKALILKNLDGLIVPGGFGSRGIEGKIRAASFAIDNDLPYLGLCLGMQMAVVALARRVLGSDANTTEANKSTNYPVIDLMADQSKIINKGGTMRLGNYPCVLDKQSHSYKAYRKTSILERHRHRFEFNNQYRGVLQKAGLVLAGVSPDKKLVELIELKNHTFFVASQFHPEFKSRPDKPHPLFNAFVQAIIKQANQKAPKSISLRAIN